MMRSAIFGQLIVMVVFIPILTLTDVEGENVPSHGAGVLFRPARRRSALPDLRTCHGGCGNATTPEARRESSGPNDGKRRRPLFRF
jgi:hypothetical protein